MEGVSNQGAMLYDGQIRTLSNGYEAILYRSIHSTHKWGTDKKWLIFKLGNRLDCLYQTYTLIHAEAWALYHDEEE